MQRGKETILIVDDEEMILDICREMLERLGYRILTAPTGKDAMALRSMERRLPWSFWI